MMERKVVIQLQHGLQARYANQFVQKSSSFNSEISIVKNGRMAAAKGIMGVMALVIRKGEEITLLANGSDEQDAIVTLEGFLSSKGC
ncbi:HPr family phosphocarrier protein [Ectobacillus funiculus]|uniref:HPr family phosphocarrier protein n=1 Tax=Ectobacillus funiculus TaxID=137993 RepID=A0ABV5WIV2_9BACI|nr:HPr family phosphocarrier protein [Ectobacillus funiculus]